MVKKVIESLGGLVLGGILLLVGFVMLTHQQGWEYNAVLSGSMEPVFHVGGLVVFKPVDVDAIKIGDIISFVYPTMKTPVCHRVIGIEKTQVGPVFTTKGDANDDIDEMPVFASMVTGLAVRHFPKVGNLLEVTKLGTKKINVLGRGVPQAVVLVFVLGPLFIFLTTRDALDEIMHPGKYIRKKSMKVRLEREARRKKLYDLA